MRSRRYRGSKYSHRRSLMIFGIIALILILITVCAYFLLKDSIVFTENGLRFTFMQDKTPPAVKPDDPPDIIIEPPSDTQTPTDTSSEPETPPAEKPVQQEALQSVLISAEKLLDNAYLDSIISLCGEKKLSAVTVVVKDENGVVNIPFTGKFATGEILSPNAAATATALKKLNDSGIKTTAYISACRDNLGARAFREGSATTGKSLWLDSKYIAWFSPYKPQIAEYLKALIDACTEQGFSEIVFDNLHFANNGKTDMLNYGQQTLSKSAAVEALTKDLCEYAGDKILLSAILTKTAAGQLKDDAAGQDAAALGSYLGHLYIGASSFDFDLSAVSSVLPEGCTASLWVTGDADLPDTSLVKTGFVQTKKDYLYK